MQPHAPGNLRSKLLHASLPGQRRRLYRQRRTSMKPEQWGPPLWEELHRWSLTTDLPSANAWLNRFWARVPCLKCKVGWFKLLTEHPPDFRSNQSLFAWSVAIHNAVNRHLGKPEL